MATVFIGSIRGVPGHRRRLRQLGVRGRMRYNPVAGRFELCRTDVATMQRLIQEWDMPKLDWIGAFHAASGVKLSPRMQREWPEYWMLMQGRHALAIAKGARR